MSVLQKVGILATVLMLNTVAAAKTQQYFGTLYRGRDTQFYLSLAQSWVFDRDVDITNNLLGTPYPKPFDRDEDGIWEAAPRGPEGQIPSKYPIGTSLVETPFVLLGAAARAVSGPPSDTAETPAPGYSEIELWTVALGLMLVFSVGVTTLFQLLSEEFGKFPAAAGIVGGWMGTSLFFYSAIFPYMSHAASFAVFVFLLVAMRNMRKSPESLNWSLGLAGLCVASLFLIRPQQVLIAPLMIPYVIRTVGPQPVSRWLAGCVIGAACCLAALAAHLWFNHTQFGVLTLSGYSANGEGFTWLAPRLDIVLVSVSRGWFFYSPIVFLAFAGILLYRKSVPSYVWPHVWNAIAQVYVIAAWSSPEQGESFGSRMLSENAVVICIGLAVLIQQLPVRLKWIAVLATAGCVGWTKFLLLNYVGVL